MQGDNTSRRPCSRSFLCAILSLGLLTALLGCDSGDRKPTARVHGKVTYKGQPVPEASLVFVPVDGGPSGQANADKSGSYALRTYASGDGAVVGDHKVMITAMTNPGAAMPEDSKAGGPMGAVSIIPQRYSDLQKSGLKATVKPKVDNEINFELTD